MQKATPMTARRRYDQRRRANAARMAAAAAAAASSASSGAGGSGAGDAPGRRVSAQVKLHVHSHEFQQGAELVLNPECFPELATLTADKYVVEIFHASDAERAREEQALAAGAPFQAADYAAAHGHLLLELPDRRAAVKGKLQASVLKDTAAAFQLGAFRDVTLRFLEKSALELEFVEISLKDQFLSRRDLWYLKQSLVGAALYVGKNVRVHGTRWQVHDLRAQGAGVRAGVVAEHTKFAFRSRTSRVMWLVQMSPELWAMANSGRLYLELLLQVVQNVLRKWIRHKVSHSLTIILFARSYYPELDAQERAVGYGALATPPRRPLPSATTTTTSRGRDATTPPLHAAQAAPMTGQPVNYPFANKDDESFTIGIDENGRHYQDFYKVVAFDSLVTDELPVVATLKQEMNEFPHLCGWRSPRSPPSAMHTDIPGASGNSDEDDEIATAAPSTATGSGCAARAQERRQAQRRQRQRRRRRGIPSNARDGNLLEAINLVLNIFEKHHIDRHLARSGQSVVLMTAGNGIFSVNRRLAEITEQRMMDHGIGIDMISLSTPPLHKCPLFLFKQSEVSHKSPPCARSHAAGGGDDACTCGGAGGGGGGGTGSAPVSAPHSTRDRSTAYTRRSRTGSADMLPSGTHHAPPEATTTALSSTFTEFSLRNGAAHAGPGPSPLVGPPPHGLCRGCQQRLLARRRYEVPLWIPLSFVQEPMLVKHPCPLDEDITSRCPICCPAGPEPTRDFEPQPLWRMFPATAGDLAALPRPLELLLRGFRPTPPPSPTTSSCSSSLDDVPMPRKFSRDFSLADAVVDDDDDHDHDDDVYALARDSELVRARAPSLSSGDEAYDRVSGAVVLPKARSFAPRDVGRGRRRCEDYDDAVFTVPGTRGWGPRHGRGPHGDDAEHGNGGGGGGSHGAGRLCLTPPLRSTAGGGGGGGFASKPTATRTAPKPMTTDKPTPRKKKKKKTRAATGSGSIGDGGGSMTPEPRDRHSGPAFGSLRPGSSETTRAPSPWPRRLERATLGASSHSPGRPRPRRSVRSTTEGSQRKFIRPGHTTDAEAHDADAEASADDDDHEDGDDDDNDGEDDDREHDGASRGRPLGGSLPNTFSLLVEGGGVNYGHSPIFRHSHAGGPDGLLSARDDLFHSHELIYKQLTSNQRRWSQVRPRDAENPYRLVQSVLKWKSLCFPALLPLTTDYIPGPKELQTHYTESFHNVMLPERDDQSRVMFRDYRELVMEMVAQRFSQDFQLVTMDEPKPGTASAAAATATTTIATTTVAAAGGRPTGAGGSSATTVVPVLASVVVAAGASGTTATAASSTAVGPGNGGGSAPGGRRGLVFRLSMGHRIHEIKYNEETQTVDVKRYLQRAKAPSDVDVLEYRYALWSPVTGDFGPATQVFHKYPTSEYAWNHLDQLICGDFDEMHEGMRYKRILFCLLPPGLPADPHEDMAATTAAVQTHMEQCRKFLDSLRAKAEAPGQFPAIRMATTAWHAGLAPSGPGAFAHVGQEPVKIALHATDGPTGQNWLITRLDTELSATQCFHLEVQWLVCRSALVDDFITGLLRRAKQLGLELVQVPENGVSADLDLHPLVSPIVIPIRGPTEQRLIETALQRRLGFCAEGLHAIPRRVLTGQQGALLHHEDAYGSPSPPRHHALGGGVGNGRNGHNGSTTRMLPLPPSTSPTPMAMYYRQYIHRALACFVRVTPLGLVWVSNRKLQCPEIQAIYVAIRELVEAVHAASEALARVVDALALVGPPPLVAEEEESEEAEEKTAEEEEEEWGNKAPWVGDEIRDDEEEEDELSDGDKVDDDSTATTAEVETDAGPSPVAVIRRFRAQQGAEEEDEEEEEERMSSVVADDGEKENRPLANAPVANTAEETAPSPSSLHLKDAQASSSAASASTVLATSSGAARLQLPFPHHQPL